MQKTRLDYLAVERFNPWVMKDHLTRDVNEEVILNKDEMMSESNDWILFLTILDKDYNYQHCLEKDDTTVYLSYDTSKNVIIGGAYSLSEHRRITCVVVAALDNACSPRYIITNEQLNSFKKCVFGA